MRLLGISFLKSCKFKSNWYNSSRKIVTEVVPPQETVDRIPAADPSLVEILPSWPETEEPELRAAVLRDMQVLPNFVSEEEESSMVQELEPRLKRMRYEFDHWDNAIQGYRETEYSNWNPTNARVMSRVLATAFQTPAAGEALPHAHVLDLASAGFIKPHIDAVRFCGEVIAGICLLSSAVMRLQHEKLPHLQVDALLERRAMYIMRGSARYVFTHAVLGGERSAWRGARLPRRRRLAVITRSCPLSEDTK
ncbi:alpha-ketoglutarate-dependent dioxygenase alkB homolog 7, mitochondrial [Plodia interpunctella]|uniref:alpha-ketoglutarate-dependent dioxygenase alkB homolog 7, mitochondrial n=1 Tax=Plodia interpunctella TaxID=58824 RepID=UPI002368866F|nr:alpha-ketoglutarate-dependent dioxygenase alkB homolog 7, mitochondrial [Plodia interpunctella]